MCKYYGHTTKPETLFEPILKMTFSHCHFPARGVEWQLSLHSQLPLNLSFPNFRLKDIAGSIEGNNMAVHSKDVGELFTFGETQSMFCVYPRGRLIHLVYMITYHLSFFSVTCDITMISQGLIFHLRNQLSHINILSSAYQHICIKKLAIFMDKIVVEKFQTICVHFRKGDSSVLFFVLFDGPGVFSKKYVIDQGVIVTASFQCLFQAVHKISNNTSAQLWNVTYFGKNISMTRIYVQNTSQSSLHFNSDIFFQTQNISPFVFLLQSPPQSAVNVTITRFTFSGQPENKCLLGGVSFYNPKETSWREEYAFCHKNLAENSTNWETARSVYSDTATHLMVIYVYKEYSVLNIATILSFTLYKVVKLQNICEKLITQPVDLTTSPSNKGFSSSDINSKVWDVVNLSPDHCTLLCLSSGLYRTVQNPLHPQHNLQIKHLFPDGCWIIVQLTPASQKYFKHTIHNFCDHVQTPRCNLEVPSPRQPLGPGKYMILKFSKSKKQTEMVMIKEFDSFLKFRKLYLSTQRKLSSSAQSQSQSNFLARVVFVLLGIIHFGEDFHFWSGSWMTYLVETATTAYIAALAKQIVISNAPRESQLHTSSSLHKVLLLRCIFVKHRSSDFPFQLQTSEMCRNGGFITGRMWRSAVHNCPTDSKGFILASPGTINFIILRFFKKPKLHCVSNQACTLQAEWIDGKKSRASSSKRHSFSQRHLFFVKFANYRFIGLNSNITEIENPFSWRAASKFCKQVVKGHLPEFIQRDDQDAFLNILKHLQDFPSMLLVFLGLQLTKARKADR